MRRSPSTDVIAATITLSLLSLLIATDHGDAG